VRDQVAAGGVAGRTRSASGAGPRSSAARWGACARSSGRWASPDRVAGLAVVASAAAASAEQIALCSTQVQAVRADPHWRGGDYHDAAPGEGPHAGLGLARRIAHVSYRSEVELQSRFGRRPQGDEDPLAGGRFAVESYLQHHADKLARRFDAGSYVALNEAMDGHDVGRGRGGVVAALGRVTARTVVVAVESDRLYPPHQQQEIADGIAGAELFTITSLYGHDGFLLETEALGPLLQRAWEPVPAR
jgi:homoserine O-acetyltransferase